MCFCFWFCATKHKTRTRTSITRKLHNKFLQTENFQYIPIQIHSVHSWMLWIKTNGCSKIKWQNDSLSKNKKKIIASKIINWKNKKKNSLTTFFDVIPKSKIPSIHMKKTETTDLKWIDRREVGLRRSVAWVWGDRRRGSERDGRLGWLVGRWHRASVGVERPELREWIERPEFNHRSWESELREMSFKVRDEMRVNERERGTGKRMKKKCASGIILIKPVE